MSDHKERFKSRLAECVAVLTERGSCFAWHPVRTSAGWVWFRRVEYVRYFSAEKGGFVTVYRSIDQ